MLGNIIKALQYTMQYTIHWGRGLREKKITKVLNSKRYSHFHASVDLHKYC